MLGAGASKSCGMPLTNQLLQEVLQKIRDDKFRDRLCNFIHYLYPHFDSKWENYPNLEEFLSLIDVYGEFSGKVKRSHLFTPEEVKELKDDLLRGICSYMHTKTSNLEIRKTVFYALAKCLQPEDTIITFNWDLLMERALTEAGVDYNYHPRPNTISLLKPHGSIDWFDRDLVSLADRKCFSLVPEIGRIKVFTLFRPPKLRSGTVPIIIPPAVRKVWDCLEFDKLWRETWRALRYADEIYVLGFSLPPEDLHVRFVIRSAIRGNEKERDSDLKLALVNPDALVLLRFSRLLESPIRFVETRLENVEIPSLISNV
jgi:hypothetical protein